MTHSDEILIHKILKFAIDLRNIRIIMSTDGMNPVMNSSTHSTWPIVLMILNLPSLLCNKQKYIMMPGLVLRPQQPENDIDTYFRPMVEDLKALSYINRVQVWDEHKREYFGLKDILFVTFSDSPTESKNTEEVDMWKRTGKNSCVHVDAYDAMGQDKYMYYGQIQEIWEFDFHGFKIPLFHCNWVDATRGVVQDKYMFISVDLNHQGYKSEPFVLAKHIAQVFFVLDTTNKRLKVLIPGKRRIIRVENAIDEEEFD
jgi:hypothetical protein